MSQPSLFRAFWRVSLAVIVFGTAPLVYADGDETLGKFSTEEGSGFVAAGVGLESMQPGTISIEIPMGATIERVLLYWQGRVDPAIDPAGDDSIILNGTLLPMDTVVMGTEIGMTNGALIPRPSFTYRADITGLNALSAGTTNMIEVSGLDFSFKNNGASIVAFLNGATTTTTNIRDGADFAFAGFSGNAQVMVPQVFTFDSAAVTRNADLLLIFGDGTDDRPDILRLTTNGPNGSVDETCNAVTGSDGPEWDTVVLNIEIPAEATSLTVEVLSTDCGKLPGSPDSLTWNVGALAITDPDIGIDIRKQEEGSDKRSFPSGSDVTFEIVVTNTGDADLTNVMVTDVLAPDCDNNIGDLAAGASVTYTCTVLNVTEGFTNEACVTGERDGQMVQDCDPSTVNIETPAGEGCTPGYWKQRHHFDSWVGFDPDDDFETVFGVVASESLTLLEALRRGGGGERALGRHAVAALLNASSGINFAFSEADVIAIVQDAYNTGNFEDAKDMLAAENEMGCPLN